MANEDTLADVLSEFARTMITDFPIQRILDRLVDRIVEVLPITSAGVTLIAEGSTPHYIAASDESARRFERLQTEIGEGPCLKAFHSGLPVALPDLTADERFPRFSPAGVAAGLGAVFTFPLCHGNERFGALDLYRDTVGDLEPDDMIAAQTLADVTAALLLNAQARQEALATSDRFHFDAMHDALTGLPNRLLLKERMEHAALRAHRTHSYTAVLFVDIDRFKQVNDSHGHLVGDQLLRSVAERLSMLIRPSDTLCRLSGDEFVFLYEDLADVDDVAGLVRRIDNTFEEPFRLDGVSVTVRASVGVAFVGPGEAITPDLLMRADLDMYRNKRTGTAGEPIRISGSRLTADERSLEDDLKRALDNEHLQVAYQPIIRTTDGFVTGVEALVRWTHARHGPISPLLMVTVAEHSDLIARIGAWVLEHACEDHAWWMQDDPTRSVDLAVNVSARQLMMPDFCPMVRDVIDRTGMDARSLVLELTESIALEHSAQIMGALAGLTELGVRLALDDFGTGFSSLSYLSRLPIQFVKIDRSLIVDLDRPSGRIVVGAVTGMAHELGLEVVAEGVETEVQSNETVAIGCDYAQGFFHGRPMTAADISELLRSATVSRSTPRLAG